MLYYKLEWPESQRWLEKINDDTICGGPDASVFVSQDLIEKKDFDNYNMD